MRRRFLALAVAVVLVAGCSSGHRAAAPPTTSPGRTAGSPNPDVIPSVITPAYVNAVFAVLNHINGNAVRAMLAAKAVTPTVITYLHAIYGPNLFPVEQRVFEAGLSQDRTNLKQPPGDRRTTVEALLSASPQCIFVRTATDLSAVEVHPTATAAAEFWELQPKRLTDDPRHINPTPWSLAYNQDFQVVTTVPDPC